MPPSEPWLVTQGGLPAAVGKNGGDTEELKHVVSRVDGPRGKQVQAGAHGPPSQRRREVRVSVLEPRLTPHVKRNLEWIRGLQPRPPNGKPLEEGSRESFTMLDLEGFPGSDSQSGGNTRGSKPVGPHGNKTLYEAKDPTRKGERHPAARKRELMPVTNGSTASFLKRQDPPCAACKGRALQAGTRSARGVARRSERRGRKRQRAQAGTRPSRDSTTHVALNRLPAKGGSGI